MSKQWTPAQQAKLDILKGERETFFNQHEPAVIDIFDAIFTTGLERYEIDKVIHNAQQIREALKPFDTGSDT